MKSLWIAAASVAVMLTAGSDVASAQSSSSRKPIRQMTCGEFLRVDDNVKPEIVHWLAIRGEPRNSSMVVDVDATDSIVPAVVERCKDAPAASLSQTVRTEVKRLGSKLYTAIMPSRTE